MNFRKFDNILSVVLAEGYKPRNVCYVIVAHHFHIHKEVFISCPRVQTHRVCPEHLISGPIWIKVYSHNDRAVGLGEISRTDPQKPQGCDSVSGSFVIQA